MDEIKILHMADIHFGRPASGLPEELRAIRRQEVRSTFSAAIALAKEQCVDAVLIAGDLFDRADTDKSTISFIAEELAKIPEIHVFASPGNHDSLGSAYDDLSKEGIENLTVFGGEWSSWISSDKKYTVYGIGFDNEVITAPLLKELNIENEDMINIALLHGELAPASDYNPITDGDIASCGADYLALGHVHAYSGLMRAGGTHYAYSGTIEGGGFDECGDKGVILARVSKGKCEAELVPLCRRRFAAIEIDVSDCGTLQKIIEKVKAAADNKNDLYKIVLTGCRPEKIPGGVIENEVDAFFVKVKDLTHGGYDLEKLSADYTIGGLFAKNILERMENADDAERADLAAAADIVMEILNKG